MAKIPKRPSAAVLEAEAKAIAARGAGYRGVLSAATEPAAKSIAAIADAEAKKEVARQYAEAQKEVARQHTHQAAVRANPAILHELDGPVITISGDMGTARRPQPYSASLSILNLFALGALSELAYADYMALEEGNLPSNMNAQFALVRSPRTELRGAYVVPPTAGEDEKAARVAKAKAAWATVQSSWGFNLLPPNIQLMFKSQIAQEYQLELSDF